MRQTHRKARPPLLLFSQPRAFAPTSLPTPPRLPARPARRTPTPPAAAAAEAEDIDIEGETVR